MSKSARLHRFLIFAIYFILFSFRGCTCMCVCVCAPKVFVLPELTGNINHITIANCKRLHIRNGTFSHCDQLNRVSFEGIDDLTMDAFALDFPVRMPTPKINVKFNRVSKQYIVSGRTRYAYTRVILFLM